MNDIKQLDFNLLKSLQALLKSESVSGAAELMGVSQPAMSASLARLRDLLEDPVLVRQGHRMVPTPWALRVAQPVNEAVEAVRKLLSPQAPQADWGQSLRKLSIATTDEVAYYLGPYVIKALRQAGSQAQTIFRTLDPGYNLTALELGEVDLVITVDWTVPEQLMRSRLYDDEFVCVLSNNHPQAQNLLSAESYCNYPHLLIAPLGGTSGPVDALLADQGLSRNISLIASNFLLAPSLLKSNRELLCTLPYLSAKKLFPAREVHLQPPPLELDKVRYDLFWHQRSHADGQHRWLRELVRQATAKMLGQMKQRKN